MNLRPSAPTTLVLLPGLDGTGKLLANFANALRPDVESTIVTYPLDQRLGYVELEQIARAALPSDREYFLLGESFGGPLAIRLAASQPPGLRGLILCGTFAKNPQPLLAWAQPLTILLPLKSMPRWLRAPMMWGSRTPADAPAQIERASAAVDERVLQHRIRSVLQVDVSDALRQIDVPVLVMTALRDRLVPAGSSDFLVRNARRAHRVDIDGPHLLLQTRTAECAEAVRAFVSAGPPATRMQHGL